MRRSDFLPSFPGHFVAFVPRYRRCALVRSCGREHDARKPGAGHRMPHPDSSTETTGSPRFLGNHCMRALLSDPGGTSALGHCCASVLPSALPTASAPTRTVISRLNHTARMLAVYASQGGLPRRHARLASGCLARRCRAGGSSCSSRWVPYRRFLLRCFLLLQAFLAHREFTVGGPTSEPMRRGRRAGVLAPAVWFFTVRRLGEAQLPK